MTQDADGTDESSTRGYSDRLLDHCNRPRNVGSLPVDDETVGTAWVEAEGCQDVVRLQIRLDPATGAIAEARFKTFGCGPAIASSSLATEWLTGRSLEQALAIGHRDLATALDLPARRVRCAVTVERAIRAAVANFRSKQHE